MQITMAGTRARIPLIRIGQAALAWKFRLLHAHRHRRLCMENLDGMPLVVLPDVFNPKLFRTSEALVRQLRAHPPQTGSSVLDVGSGSGVGGIAAALLGARVVAIDTNPEAVRCTRLNAVLNRVDHLVEARQGYLFEPARGQRFDLILFNPPFYRGEPRALWEQAWCSTDALDRFATGLATALSDHGRVLVVLSTHTHGLERLLNHPDLQWRSLWSRRGLTERLWVFEGGMR